MTEGQKHMMVKDRLRELSLSSSKMAKDIMDQCREDAARLFWKYQRKVRRKRTQVLESEIPIRYKEKYSSQ